MRVGLKAFVWLFGAVCCLIALSHIILGHASVPGAAPAFSPTDDSEDRFYATLFLGFGAALIWCSRDLQHRDRVFAALLTIFFLGGLARVISAIAVGWPIHMFIALGSLELALPPLLWWWHNSNR